MGFSMMGALGSKNISNTPEIKMINIADILPDEHNFYRVAGDENIEQQNELLKADVLERGIENPIKVKMLDGGKFSIISGHRRCEICRRLVADGNDKFKFIPAIISKKDTEKTEEINNINDEINLIMSNATTRQLSDWEKVQQVGRLNELYQKLKTAGEKIPGRIDEIIGQQLNMSKSAVGRAKNIDKNLSDTYKDELKGGNISVSTANKLATKPKQEQEELHKNNPAPKLSDLEQANSLLPDAPKGKEQQTTINKQPAFYEKISASINGETLRNIFIELCTDKETGKLAAYINIDEVRYAISLPNVYYFTQEAIEKGMKML